MRNKRYILLGIIIVLVGAFYYPLQAQQKTNTQRANFSGEWKSKESISMGGNIVCSYDLSDRMNSKSMKITEQSEFLNIEIPDPTSDAALSRSQEKLPFNGKESEINHGQGLGKKFTVKLSADGQTTTINSIALQRKVIHYVKEVWKLSSDGKSIILQSNAKSNVWGEERSWKTIFYKTY